MERRRAWQRTLNEGRWAAINWPAEWGGRDATVTQNVIYSERWRAYRTPGIYNANGLWQIGPMIIRWGTDEQKDRWIPNILNADDHWCQGFSEPAGRLATSPTCAPSRSRDGDDYVLNGQKIWISSRTSPSGACSSCAPTPTAIERGASTKASPRSSSTSRRDGIDVPPDPRHHRRGDVQRGLLHRRARARRVPARRRGRGLAGRDGHARPRTRRHRRAWRSACAPTSTSMVNAGTRR